MARTKEQIAQYKKEWREKNKERIQAYDRERYKDPKRRESSIKRACEYMQSEKRKQWREDNREKNREYARNKYWETKHQLKHIKRYGITLEEYEAMYEKQEGKCFICRIPSEQLNRPLNVDHCHITGKVRKLLCGNCNSAIGLVEEDIDTINRLIDYLKWHSETKINQTSTIDNTGKK